MITLQPPIQQNKRILFDKTSNKTYIKGTSLRIIYEGKLLGTGGFAKAYQAMDQQTNHLYAAKVIPKKSINQKRQRYKLLIEIRIHKELKHKHIVEFINAFQDKQNIYIMLEYCRNYTLKDLVKRRKRLTEHETRMYVSQVVKALVYIHQQGIIHRDLKLGNILINDQMEAKICDFGLSTRVKSQAQVKKTICGTPNYIAPEILQENGHSYEVDIWSIGVIMYTLLFGKPPFQQNTVEQTYQNIKNNRYVFPTRISCSQAAKDLMTRILVMDPAKRLSLQQILQHQFMQIPEGMPSNLPVWSLAVPPLNLQRQQQIKLNLSDIQYQNSSQQLESGLLVGQRRKGRRQTLPMSMNIYKQSYYLSFVAIREIFIYEDSYGYLLTSGIVGMFIKKHNINLVLQFGQQHYYIIQPGNKPKKYPVPQQNEQSSQIQRLLHFKSYYNQKYSLFKLQQMSKRSPQRDNDMQISLIRCFNLTQHEILTRLSNAVIQLHFADFTSLIINRNDQKGVYYIDQKGMLQFITQIGKQSEINYGQCRSAKLKTKVRRFSNLMRRLSEGEQQDQGNGQQQQQQESLEKYYGESRYYEQENKQVDRKRQEKYYSQYYQHAK